MKWEDEGLGNKKGVPVKGFDQVGVIKGVSGESVSQE